MAITVKVDSLRDLSCIERWGKIVELHREAICHGFTGTDIKTDWTVLQACLANLGVPGYFTSPSGDNNLILVERRCSLVGEEKAAVRVELTYERVGQSIRSMNADAWLVRISGALNATRTTAQLDNPANDNDVFYNPVIDDEDYFPGMEGQKAEVTVHSPEITIEAESKTTKTISQMVSFMKDYLGRVNSMAWFGMSAKRWKCTDCQADPLDWVQFPVTPFWHLKMQFQLSPKMSGWEEVAQWKHPNSGRAPVDLGPEGEKVIALMQADFNDIIPG